MKAGDVRLETGCDNTAGLEKRHWRLWCLMVFVTSVNVAVLVTAQLLLYSGLIENDWPWQNTHQSLLAALSLAIIGFIFYLTVQKKQILAMERQINAYQQDANRRMNRNSARFIAISNVSRKMCDESDPQRIFNYITKTCTRLFKCDRASLMILDESADELVVRAVSPVREDHYTGVRQKMGAGIAGRVAQTRKALLLRRDLDYSEFRDAGISIDNSISAMVVPIVLRNDLVGIINVSTADPDREYEDDDMNALQVFAENAGAFIRHSEKAEWMRKTIERLGRISNEDGSECGCISEGPPVS